MHHFIIMLFQTSFMIWSIGLVLQWFLQPSSILFGVLKYNLWTPDLRMLQKPWPNIPPDWITQPHEMGPYWITQPHFLDSLGGSGSKTLLVEKAKGLDAVPTQQLLEKAVGYGVVAVLADLLKMTRV